MNSRFHMLYTFTIDKNVTVEKVIQMQDLRELFSPVLSDQAISQFTLLQEEIEEVRIRRKSENQTKKMRFGKGIVPVSSLLNLRI